MPPPSASPCLDLLVLPKPFFVAQYKLGEVIPQELLDELILGANSLLSITRTFEEISIAGEVTDNLPAACKDLATWTCIKLKGPMDFGLTGVIASFTAPLKEAKVPVFAVSTWNTDFVLVPTTLAKDAIQALKADGWTFSEAPLEL